MNHISDAEKTFVAAFDVDKTLVVRDCVFPFMLRVAGRRRLAGLLAKNGPALVGHSSRRDRDMVKRVLVSAVFAGRTASDVREIGAAFAQSVASSWIRPDVARRLRFHQDQGHRVVLVSASLDAYLDPLGDIIGVDEVLCTRLEVDGAGAYTGNLVGGNCRGQAKVDALVAAFGPISAEENWLAYAYGDSSGDRDMLEAASIGINVKRTTLSASC